MHWFQETDVTRAPLRPDASVHNAVPSNTSRYTATDLGIVHVIGLDLMNFDAAQAAWLEADLKAAAANRKAVPWM